MSAATILQVLADMPTELHQEYLGLDTDLPLEARVILLAELRRARARLDLLGKQIEDDITNSMFDKRTEIEGIGEVEVLTGTRRTQWQHDDLVKRVTALALDEREVDEDGVSEPGWEAVARVLTECAHIDYWRKTDLEAHGVDIDEFCTTSYGRKTVRMKALPI